ncbi:ABATE domain-containing protein [Actinosynnema sp. CS-041913]|uniref:ABATE domain-containing protein n=1 Tax=Actinosynnema sp. CS-041913 TaxID=3239917 RepID=UPI003D916028
MLRPPTGHTRCGRRHRGRRDVEPVPVRPHPTGVSLPGGRGPVVGRIAAVASALREVFTADDPDVAVGYVNDLLAEFRVQPRLARHGDQSWWHLHYTGTVGGLAGEWAGACAAAFRVRARSADPATRTGVER